jgi:hypothetical protein
MLTPLHAHDKSPPAPRASARLRPSIKDFDADQGLVHVDRRSNHVDKSLIGEERGGWALVR